MSSPKRHFINRLKDYSPSEELKIHSSTWKVRICKAISAITNHQPPSVDDCDGGLYVGCSGVGYMMYHVSQSEIFRSEKEEYIKQGLSYMSVALQYAKSLKTDSKSRSSFLLGNAGVCAVSAGLYVEAGTFHLGSTTC